MQTWHRHATISLARWQNSQPDTSACNNTGFELYCTSKEADRHLANTDLLGIIPYCWVEACGVNLSDDGCNIPGPGGVNAVRKLKYFDTVMSSAALNAGMSEDERGCIDGTAECYTITHWQARTQGMCADVIVRITDLLQCRFIRLCRSR